MRDDRADNQGRDLPLTGRGALDSPEDLWADFVRSHRRVARRALTRFELAIAVLIALGFCIMGVHVAADIGPHHKPPPVVYQPSTATQNPSISW